MHVPAQDADADGEGFGEFLDAVDEFFPLLFVLVRGVMVVQVVEQIDAAVELVEEAAGDAEAFVEEADGADDGGLEDVLQPLQTWVCDGNAQEQDQMLDLAVRSRDLR